MQTTSTLFLRAVPLSITAFSLCFLSAWTAHAETATFSVLYTFTGAGDGGYPTLGPLIRDQAGNLYGTTYQGGDPTCGEPPPLGCGVAFRVSPSGAETALLAFSEANGDTTNGGLKRDAAGNLYGTTVGIGGGAYGGGTVFQISPTGAANILYAFSIRDSKEGFEPLAGLLGDPNGNLYGTTFRGGRSSLSAGTVFRLSAKGVYTVLHSFQGSPDGAFPAAGLIRDAAGNLYGTTESGGLNDTGTIFKIDPAGKLTVLHSFSLYSGDSQEYEALTMDSVGDLYGVNSYGGHFGEGEVFELSAGGTYRVLYSFTGKADGDVPAGVLAYAPESGYLFGTTEYGGAYGRGAVFALKVATGEEHVLYSFKAGADGKFPNAGLLGVPGPNRSYNLFGTTTAAGDQNGCYAGCGTVFQVSVAP